MPTKKTHREPPLFHAEPSRKPVLKRKRERDLESALWSDIAPDTFEPDKPDQEIGQIMSYKDTHKLRIPSKRRKGKKS